MHPSPLSNLLLSNPPSSNGSQPQPQLQPQPPRTLPSMTVGVPPAQSHSPSSQSHFQPQSQSSSSHSHFPYMSSNEPPKYAPGPYAPAASQPLPISATATTTTAATTTTTTTTTAAAAAAAPPPPPPAPKKTTSKRASTQGSPHVCPDCQRQYSRPEHLARHIQTHTLGKRFPCPVCGKAFARTDLLRRHTQNHQNNDGTKKRRTGTASTNTSRVSHACKQCSTARVKCEEVKPCTRCRNRNLNCEYNASEAALAHHNPHMRATAAVAATTSAAAAAATTAPHIHTRPTPSIQPLPVPSMSAASPLKHAAFEPPPMPPTQPVISMPPPPPAPIASSPISKVLQPQYPVASSPNTYSIHDQDIRTSASPSQGSPWGSTYSHPTPDAHRPSHTNSPLSQQHTPSHHTPSHHTPSHHTPSHHTPSHHTPSQQTALHHTPSQLTSSARHDGTLLTQDNTTEEYARAPSSHKHVAPSPIQPPPLAETTPRTSKADGSHALFTDYLRDVMFESDDGGSHPFDESIFPVLDFCTDVSLELNEDDYGLMDYLNLNLELPANSQNLNSHEEAANLVKLRRELSTMWFSDSGRFVTDTDEGTSGTNQAHLDVGGYADCSIPAMEESRKKLYTVFSDKVTLSGRDGVLALILATCKNSEMIQKVSASFPSLEAMDGFVHIFLAAHFGEMTNFLHFPTLKLKDQSSDWLATVVACGAVRTSAPTIQRFGFAVQEAVRVSIALRLEGRTDIFTDKALLQATVLFQDLGLWSGYRTKMVAAESYLSFPINVLRSRNRFRRATYPHIDVHPDDHGQVLEDKWKTWYEHESWKRIVFHCYVRDAQWSILASTNPLMSYFELALPLPEPNELWTAKSAVEWKALYLKMWADGRKRPPCVGDLMRNITILKTSAGCLDVRFAIAIYLSSMWCLIHEYNQLSSVHGSRSFFNRNQAGNSSTLLSERHQELYKELDSFRQLTINWGLSAAMSSQQNMMLHTLMMHLHVSIEDINMFFGRGGEELMRQAYPSLKQWTESTEAREALWHAGQTLRYAKMFAPGTLRDFWVIALFQAGLTIWTYGVVTNASKRKRHAVSSSGGSGSGSGGGSGSNGLRRAGSTASSRSVLHIPGCFMNEPLFLDGDNGTAVIRYLSMGQGQPLIRGPAAGKNGGGRAEVAVHASPNDPHECIDVVREILASNYAGNTDSLPTLACNLMLMMEHLSRVAAHV